MKYSIQDHTGKDCDVHIRMAEETDVMGFLEINHAYQREKLGGTQNGFLSASFTSDMFLALINSKDIIVGTENTQIISYYLVNTINKEGVLERHKRVVKFLKENGVLRKNALLDLGFKPW